MFMSVLAGLVVIQTLHSLIFKSTVTFEVKLNTQVTADVF